MAGSRGVTLFARCVLSRDTICHPITSHLLTPALPIFDGVHEHLSPSLSPTRRTDLQSILNLNGTLHAAAQKARLTHVVTNTPHIDGAHRSVKVGVKVTSDRWVDCSVIMGKLQFSSPKVMTRCSEDLS
ncbi:hypothetical protein BV22DRAFT_1037968 [Leucogyrophana mollusca]|uniref:Uncharacterized protein n=1 Tax=Leucogyrophana mollusca TaxID=85980 RepID=A0ACB8B8I9_9AGAM|nr:hypothetical protein BV22DRAFT_1037968 [Leucogyrophana mollusca]